jgi:nucleotide-binding universal stress UspA family protein
MQTLTRNEEQATGTPLRTILLATDGSEDAHLALVAAVDLARRSGAALHLVTAYQLPPGLVSLASNYLGPSGPLDAFEHRIRLDERT